MDHIQVSFNIVYYNNDAVQFSFLFLDNGIIINVDSSSFLALDSQNISTGLARQVAEGLDDLSEFIEVHLR